MINHAMLSTGNSAYPIKVGIEQSDGHLIPDGRAVKKSLVAHMIAARIAFVQGLNRYLASLHDVEVEPDAYQVTAPGFQALRHDPGGDRVYGQRCKHFPLSREHDESRRRLRDIRHPLAQCRSLYEPMVRVEKRHRQSNSSATPATLELAKSKGSPANKVLSTLS